MESFASDRAINIAGAMVATQAVAGSMAERGGGTILLTGGGFGLTPAPDFISLSIGKAGLRTLALGIFEPLKNQGIHIGIVNVAAMVEPESQTSITQSRPASRSHTPITRSYGSASASRSRQNQRTENRCEAGPANGRQPRASNPASRSNAMQRGR